MISNLPMEMLNKIFEYDGTYREKYNEVMDELQTHRTFRGNDPIFNDLINEVHTVVDLTYIADRYTRRQLENFVQRYKIRLTEGTVGRTKFHLLARIWSNMWRAGLIPRQRSHPKIPHDCIYGVHHPCFHGVPHTLQKIKNSGPIPGLPLWECDALFWEYDPFWSKFFES